MKGEREFVMYLSEVFRSFGSISSRRMFGGYGIYHQGLMFGLVADDELYLKADSISAPDFSKAGSLQFEYVKNGVPMKMSYFSAPEEIFENQEIASVWANRAFEAALRAKRPAAKRTK